MGSLGIPHQKTRNFDSPADIYFVHRGRFTGHTPLTNPTDKAPSSI